MVLHLVSCANTDHPSFSLCLESLQDGDAVVFLTDPKEFWEAARKPELDKLRLLAANSQCHFYQLNGENTTPVPELGIPINPIAHGELVDLSVAAPVSQSWY